MLPGQQLGVAAITNGQPTGVPEAMVESVLDLVIEGEVTKDWAEMYGARFESFYEPQTPTDWSEAVGNPVPPADPEILVGTYDNAYFGPLTVSARGDDLVMTLGPEGMEFPLEH